MPSEDTKILDANWYQKSDKDIWYISQFIDRTRFMAS